jgi:colicin import membrane protein
MSRRARVSGGGRRPEERIEPGEAPVQPSSYVLEGNTVVDPGAGPPPPPQGAAEPAAHLTDLLSTAPLFTVVRRGYDQHAVDAYVDAAEEQLGDLRRRLHVAVARHRAAVDALVASRRPDERAEEILASARAEAEARLANVAALREAATAARDEARRDRALAAGELQAARREAEEVRRAAAAAREDAEATAALRRAALESEMACLRRERDEAVAHLQRLTGQIERALHTLTAVLPPETAVPDDRPELLAG